MITQLSGNITFTGNNYVVLDVAGVGYKVHVSLDTLRALTKERAHTVSLWTHLAVRETSLDLYGFLEQPELEFFEML
ncbi:MAG: Holliday junction branch migration protein RuvA, partial [Patescibacteria group bacterium]|nr:Holliday junction branch migration protein RuvA [Patescibacteria group bacterium]